MSATNHQAMIEVAKANAAGVGEWVAEQIEGFIEDGNEVAAGGFAILFGGIAVATAMTDALMSGVPESIQGEAREYMEQGVEHMYSLVLAFISDEHNSDRQNLREHGVTDFGNL